MDEPLLRADEIVRRVTGEADRLWEPRIPSPLVSSLPAREIAEDPSLAHLHRHWALPDRPDPAGGGLRGRLRSLAGRLVFANLQGYLRQERELLSSLVRTCDTLAKRCDQLAEVHHQLVRELNIRAQDAAAGEARLAALLDRRLTQPPGHASPTR